VLGIPIKRNVARLYLVQKIIIKKIVKPDGATDEGD